LSIVNFPWLVKFIWAPLVDKFWFRGLGRRKSWILPAQGGLVLALLVTGYLAPSLSLYEFIALLTVVNFFAATQDIAVDGLAVDILGEEERGMGNAIQAAAFKVGMLGGGFGLTFVMANYSVAYCFYAMAGAVMLVMAAPFLVREHLITTEEQEGVRIFSLIREFFTRQGALWFLLFILISKSGDALANPLFRLFLRDERVSIGTINWIMNLGGIVATLLGSLLCGWFIARFGRARTTMAAVMGQGVSHLLWTMIALSGIVMPVLWSIALFEHFVSGMLTVAVFTVMMDSVDRRAGGTLYTLLMCIHLGAVFILGIVSGMLAQRFGFAAVYTAAGLITLTTLVLFPALSKSNYFSGHIS
ncbi:MFS transporter, partial [Myxococcota bacterium]|nr:MFS transporter [Myxococcota bacterium]MBU1535897.1 MFS transporter [Myxococcota bacterium]